MIIATRRLGEIHFSVILLYYFFLSTIFLGGTIWASGSPSFLYQKPFEVVGFALLMAVLYFVGQVSLCMASQRSNPNKVSLMQYMAMVYNFIVDLMIFNETFTLQQLLGTFIILICLILTVLSHDNN
jgi:drug/metabolite transporter (DMT)-like permease